MKNTFFELIRLSIGTESGLSRQLSVGEWEGMYQIAVQQSLVEICMAGVKKFLDLVNIIDSLVPLIKASHFNKVTKECLYSFAGYELSVAMSSVHRLNMESKLDIRKRLKQLCWLLKYTQNPKVRMVSRVYNIFGYAITERVLRLYNWYKSRK